MWCSTASAWHGSFVGAHAFRRGSPTGLCQLCADSTLYSQGRGVSTATPICAATEPLLSATTTTATTTTNTTATSTEACTLFGTSSTSQGSSSGALSRWATATPATATTATTAATATSAAAPTHPAGSAGPSSPAASRTCRGGAPATNLPHRQPLRFLALQLDHLTVRVASGGHRIPRDRCRVDTHRAAFHGRLRAVRAKPARS
mmetsp:Transcript_83134/g.182633  ORF Transcript_83134/g.182633 Transcript_83134/m.182633 type:complete len:204 (-) Transcript_83134:564-1175(-)